MQVVYLIHQNVLILIINFKYINLLQKILKN